MKNKELTKKSDKELVKLKKQLELGLIRSKCDWSSKEEKDMKGKSANKQGINTKQTLNIRRILARINNILNQRGLSEELCKNKPRSKRRERRLRGRKKAEKAFQNETN